jgi:hypothetical protein
MVAKNSVNAMKTNIPKQTFGCGSAPLLVFTLALWSVCAVQAQVILNDSFESYVPGTFPASGGWQIRYEGEGAASQFVSNARPVTGSNSLHLVGSGCWAANIFHPLNFDQTVSCAIDQFMRPI